MTEVNVKIQRRGDTIYVRSGKYVESFNATYMRPSEVVDRVRWILITSGASLSEDTLERWLEEEQ